MFTSQIAKRPALLAALVALSAGLALGALAALANVRAEAMARPRVLAAQAQGLEEALQDAPSIGMEGAGQVVWVLTAPSCQACRDFEQGPMRDLIDYGIDVRVVITPPQAKAPTPEARALAAGLARRRDWTAYEMCLVGRGLTAQSQGAAVACPRARDISPEELDGFLEWSRQSFERVASVLLANDLKPVLPIVLWREGPEWRAATGAAPRGLRQAVRRQTRPPAQS